MFRSLIWRAGGQLLAGLFFGLAGNRLAAVPNSAWNLRVWQSDEGLPDNSVVGIGQTEDGFVWVATQGGLVRFDGLQFQESAAATSAGTPSGLMRVLCVDRQNRIWVAKNLGVLVCIDQAEVTAFTAENGMPLARAKMLVAEEDGTLWVAYSGSTVVRVRGGQLRLFTPADGMPTGDTYQLARDRAGQMWCVVGEKVGVFRNEKFIPLLSLPEGRCIAAARSGGVWICAGTQVFHYEEGGELRKVCELPTSTHKAKPTIAFEDHGGALWVGTSDAGLFRFEGSVVESVNTSHRDISSIAEDVEGNVWVGTMGGGLNRLRRSIVELQPTGPGQSFVGLRSVCQDKDGTLWAVDRSGNVARNQGGRWREFSTNEGWTIQNASSIAADPSGGVWIGTENNGLHLWREKLVRSISQSDGLARNFVRSLLVSPSGDLWVGSTGEDLQRWREGKFMTVNLPPESGSVRAMTFDASGVLWVGTGSGSLLKVDHNSSVSEILSSAAGRQSVRCLRATADGSLWIGYSGAGLGRLKAGRFTQYNTSQGLFDNYISEVLEDGHGCLWFAGNRGIFFVRLKEFDELAEGDIKRVHSVVFGRDEGLPALQASWVFWPGAMQTGEGQLYFAMQTALAVVHTEILAYKTFPPPVVIESVAVDKQEVASCDAYPKGTNSVVLLQVRKQNTKIYVRADHQQVTFSFTAPSFVSPKNQLFKYQLEGLDSGFIEANTRKVNYGQIAPGHYRFHVIACNSAGRWNEVGAAVELVVEPQFWQRAWFRVLEIALGCGLLAGGTSLISRLRYRRKLQLLEQQQALERERTRIAQDLHDDLGAGLVEISFGSELAGDPALNSQEAREHTREIGNRAREMVIALDEIVWAVNPKHDNVVSLITYLCQYSQHFLKPTRLRCHLEIAKNLPAAPLNSEERHNLFLAFKEALSNAVQHSGATDLRLEITAADGILTLILSDNGHGFDPAALRNAHGADGLGNMERRLAHLRGEYQLSSSPDKGTTITFKIPLRGLKNPGNR